MWIEIRVSQSFCLFLPKLGFGATLIIWFHQPYNRYLMYLIYINKINFEWLIFSCNLLLHLQSTLGFLFCTLPLKIQAVVRGEDTKNREWCKLRGQWRLALARACALTPCDSRHSHLQLAQFPIWRKMEKKETVRSLPVSLFASAKGKQKRHLWLQWQALLGKKKKKREPGITRVTVRPQCKARSPMRFEWANALCSGNE